MSRVLKYAQYFLLLLLILALGMAFKWRNKLYNNFGQQKTVIKIGICCGEPPYEYLDTNGQIEGVNKKLIEKSVDVPDLKKIKIQWHVLPFGEAFLSLDKGKIDMLATFLHINDERKKRYDFAVISNSYLVGVVRNTKNPIQGKNLTYGLQSEAIFEKEARKQGIKYKGYPKADDLFFNFELEKVDGMIIDIQTLKHYILSKPKTICNKSEVKIKYLTTGSGSVIRIKNEHQSLANQGTYEPKIINSMNKNKKIRIYRSFQDLLIAFRCGELYKITIETKDYKSSQNLMTLSVNYNHPKIAQFLGANNKINLKLTLYKNHMLVTKEDRNTEIKKCGILEQQKVNSLGNYGYSAIKVYQDSHSMIIDLLKGEIDGLVFHKFSDQVITPTCEIANISFRSEVMSNGFAFLKESQGLMTDDLKAKIIGSIEEKAPTFAILSDFIEYKKDTSKEK